MPSERLQLIFDFLTRGKSRAEASKRLVSDVRKETKLASRDFKSFQRDFRNLQQRQEEQLRTLRKVATATRKVGEAGTEAGQKLKTGFTGSFLQAQVLFEVLRRGVGIVKEFVVESTNLAAINQTLNVVTGQLAKANELNRDKVFGVVEAVKAQGITTRASMNIINRMIFAQLDLAKAADLARIAQNAAQIVQENSSESLNRIILGITTRQVRVLRTMGINVLFEESFTKAARERKRELTGIEKNQLALNLVLAQGAKIAGAYEAALFTVGKQLRSFERHSEEAKAAIGESFLPALGKAVDMMERFAKATRESAEQGGNLVTNLTGLGVGTAVGLATLQFTKRPILSAIAGVGAGLATAEILDIDRVEQTIDRSSREIKRLQGELAKLEEQARLVTAGRQPFILDRAGRQITAVRAKDRAKEILEGIKGIRQSTIRELARILPQEGAQARRELETVLPTLRATDPTRQLVKQQLRDLKVTRGLEGVRATTELAPGVRIFRDEIRGVIERKGKGAKLAPGEKLLSSLADDELKNTILRLRETQALAEREKRLKQIKSLEQQAAVAGLTGLTRLNAERETALALLGKQADEIRRVNAAFNTLRGVEVKSVIERNQQLAARGLAGFTREFQPSVGLDALTQRFEDQQKFQADSLKAEIAFIKTRLAGDQQVREHRVRLADIQTRAQERIIELTAGPAGELGAIKRIERLRKDAAQRRFRELGDQRRLTLEVAQIELDTQVRIAELQRRRIDEWRQAAGQIFDAMTAAGGGGLGDFFRGQAKVLQRQIFINLAGFLFEKLGPLLGKAGGKQGSGGKLGKFLDILLRGTIFERQNTEATDKNTTSTDSNTEATRLLTEAMERVREVMRTVGANQPPVILGGGIGGGGLGGNNPLGGLNAFPGAGKAASKLGLTPEQLGGLAAGGLQVGVGLKRGGKGGNLQATGGALLMAAPFTGPAAPFVAGAGAALIAISSILPGAKNRAERHHELVGASLERNKFELPEALDASFDFAGNPVDFGARGQVRVIEKPVQVQVNISAIDSQSFLDRRADIMDAVRYGIQHDGGLVSEIREQLRPN